MSRSTRAVRLWLEDLAPPVTVPLARWLTAAKPAYRAHLSEERRLRDAIGPDGVVAGGPFAGLRYLHESSGSVLLAKLAGTYELEIADAVEAAIAGDPDVIVNVGAAEGYYAVGLAVRVRGARVVAYDMRASARWQTARLARANDAQVEVRGEADHAALQRDLEAAARPLVVCDIDGGELSLLDPVQVPALTRTRVIVETHDVYVAHTTQRLRERFMPTHHVESYDAQPRPAELLPALPAADARWALDERRPHQGWLVAIPR